MRLITIEELSSTNNYAKGNLSALEDKTIVRAVRQFAGRGRFARSWVDFGPGNLFVSFVLKPSNSFRPEYSNLTQYLSVVLCKVLEDYNLSPQIKWPNDVLVNGKKIAGILAETVISGSIFKGIVLGLGVNLSVNKEDLSLVGDREVTSLNLETGKVIPPDEFLSLISQEFFAGYDYFLKKGFNSIKSDYISRASFIDTEVSIQGINDCKSGIASDVNDNGELILKTEKGLCTLNIGDML